MKARIFGLVKQWSTDSVLFSTVHTIGLLIHYTTPSINIVVDSDMQRSTLISNTIMLYVNIYLKR